ncbi:hypothetical protein SDC9_128657 [bioreactor metagenome]|uniref:Uncharacterized protein n=1 Tax=bioreactor metagenome TaxID=1076179 RepID=A0A645CXH0_9ZZZZ
MSLIIGISTVGRILEASEALVPLFFVNRYSKKMENDDAKVFNAIPTKIELAPRYMEKKAMDRAITTPLTIAISSPSQALCVQ